MNRFISLTGLKWRDSAASHLSVTAVFLALVTTLTAQQPPEFQSAQWTLGPSGKTKLTAGQNGALTKSAGISTLWDAGAVAGNRILRDGGVSFKGLAGGVSHFAVGLNLVDSNELNTDIDHAILLLSNNTAQVYHGAAAGVSLGSFTNQTEFTIRRVGSQVLFFKDNDLMHTSTTASVGIMSVDCSFYKPGSQMTSCLIATGDLDNDGMPDAWEEKQLPASHSWNDVVAFLRSGGVDFAGDADQDETSNFEEYESGTSASDPLSRTEPVVWPRDGAYQLNTSLTTDKGGIKKQTPGTTAVYNSRAFASKYIKEDGLLVFRLTPGTIATVGLNTSNVMTTVSAPDVEWAISTTTTGTYTINANAAAPTLAAPVNSYTAETIFAIQRKAGQVQFLKDGVVIHAALAWSSEPLYPNVWLSSPGAQLTLARLDTGDMDEDGLPDIWERSYLPPDSGWSALQAFKPGEHADDTDLVNGQKVSTGDNVSNGSEFISGTSPIDPLSRADAVNWGSGMLNVITTVGNTNGGLTKTSTSTTYNARALATKGILEDGLVAFQVSGIGVMTFGLNTSNVMPLATSVTPDVEWAFITTATGTYTIKANPTAIAPPTGLGTYTSNMRPITWTSPLSESARQGAASCRRLGIMSGTCRAPSLKPTEW